MPLYCTALEREVERKVERKVEKEFEKRGMTFLARESLCERLKSLECIKGPDRTYKYIAYIRTPVGVKHLSLIPSSQQFLVTVNIPESIIQGIGPRYNISRDKICVRKFH